MTLFSILDNIEKHSRKLKLISHKFENIMENGAFAPKNWCSRPAGFILINCKFYRNFILCKQSSDQLTADYRPAMTIAVDLGRKATKQTKQS